MIYVFALPSYYALSEMISYELFISSCSILTNTYISMKKASNYAFLGKRSKEQEIKPVSANVLFGAPSPKV